MTLKPRDKRALILLGVAAVIMLLYRIVAGGGETVAVARTADSIPAAQKRLERVRRLASGVTGREQVLKQVSAGLAQREKGLIQAETAPQAQAQLINVLKRIAGSQQPPIELGMFELNQQIAKLGDDYGEVQVSFPFTCHIEDLVNFLADLTRQPEALATTDLRVTAVDATQKTMAVRLTVAGVVAKRLVPQKRASLYP